jgi:tetratricopeptide (TPR) repeat protein
VIIFYFTYYFWINTYNQLEKINISKDFKQIEIVETPVYYGGTPRILYSLGGSYFQHGRYKESSQIDEQLLKVWPNHLDALWRLAYAKHKLNQNTKALELAAKLKELEPQGLYYSYIAKMFIYSSTQEVNKFQQTFNELLSQPESFLKLNADTYRFLLFFTLMSKDLSQHAPRIYDKYKLYWGFHCEVENNIAIHYFNLEQFKLSAQHAMKAIKKNGNCLNPQLIKLLDEKGLITIKSD